MRVPGEKGRRLNLAAAILLVCCLAIGCGESFYDSMKLSTMSEHIGHQNSTVDLFWTLRQHNADRALLAGCRPSRLYPGIEDTTEKIDEINKVVLALHQRAPAIIAAFPMIRTDDPDPLLTAKTFFENGAYGVALDPSPGQEIFSKPMQRLYEACELSGAPIVCHFDADRFDDLRRLAGDYPQAILIVPQMAGFPDDLPRLDSLLWQNNNVYLGLGFGPEDVLIQSIATLSKDIPRLKKFIADHLERLCFSTETNLTEEPYRNSTLAESQVRFLRRFLEKDKAQLKIKGRDGKWIDLDFPGLALDKQTLGYLYRLNFDRALTGTRAELDQENIDRVIPDLPAGARYDEDSKDRFLPAVVINHHRAVTGISSAKLRKMVSGTMTDFAKFSRSSGKLELVSHGPVAKWVAKRLKVEPSADIRVINDAEAFVKYMLKSKNAIGFCAFGDLDPRLRTLTLDGETPVVPYIKYCAAKGAGRYDTYFGTYPILLPVALADDTPVPRFDPHRLNRFAFAGPGRFGKYEPGRNAAMSTQRPTIDVAPYMREAGLTAMSFSGPIKNDCASDDCSNAAFFPGILATGIDVFMGEGAGLDELFGPHLIQKLRPGNPILRTVRGQQMALVGGKATGLDLETLVNEIKTARANNAVVAAALWSEPGDFDLLAQALAKAGAAGVVNLKSKTILPWEVTRDSVIAPGLGEAFVPKMGDSIAVILVVTFYGNKMIEAEPIMVHSTNGATRKMSGKRGVDELRALVLSE